MNTKKYNVLGMSCEGCQKKISSTLNNVEGIKADVNLSGNFVEIISEQEIDIEKLNSELKNAGNYVLEDPENPKFLLQIFIGIVFRFIIISRDFHQIHSANLASYIFGIGFIAFAKHRTIIFSQFF